METRKAGHENSCVVDKGAVAFHSTDSLLLDITVNIYCWNLESPRPTLPVLTKKHHLPQSNGQQMRQQQRWKKNLQKVCWENAPFLHNACISHAECSCSLRMFKKELPGVERNYQSMRPLLVKERAHDTENTYLGGIFSGRLDQSHIQSEFFFKMLSTSLLLSI